MRQRNARSQGLPESLSAHFSKLLSQKSRRPQLPLLFVETADLEQRPARLFFLPGSSIGNRKLVVGRCIFRVQLRSPLKLSDRRRVLLFLDVQLSEIRMDSRESIF